MMRKAMIYLLIIAGCFLFNGCGRDINDEVKNDSIGASAVSSSIVTSNSIENEKSIEDNDTILKIEIKTNQNYFSSNETQFENKDNPNYSISNKEKESEINQNNIEAKKTTDNSSIAEVFFATDDIINSYLPGSSYELEKSILHMKELNENTQISDIKHSYSQTELISQIGFMCPFNISTTFCQLDKYYSVEYLHIPDGETGVGYCVYRLIEGGKLFVFFDDNPDGRYHVTLAMVQKELLTQEDFSQLSVGLTLNDVVDIDEGCKILNTVNSNSLVYNTTFHIVKGGFVQIQYENCGERKQGYSDEDFSNFKISSIKFIPNGGFISFPNELNYDCINGGFNYYIEPCDYY
jgi:hypothetical protein